MLKKITKPLTYWLSVVSVGLVLGFSIQFVTAWTEPTATPPGGNVGAPINTSATDQTKLGGLGVNSPGNALLVPNGRVGIGTTSPHAAASLHVEGFSFFRGLASSSLVVGKDYVSAGATDACDPYGEVNYPDSTEYQLIGVGCDNLNMDLRSNNHIYLFSNNSTTPSISADKNGNVGIGNSGNPQYKLDVAGPINYDNQKQCYVMEYYTGNVTSSQVDVDGIISTSLAVPNSWTMQQCARAAYDFCSTAHKSDDSCRFQLVCIGVNGEHNWTGTFQASTYLNSNPVLPGKLVDILHPAIFVGGRLERLA